MEIIDISYLHLCIGLALLLIPLYFLHYYRTGLIRSTLIASGRMVAQLLFIGFYLNYLFEWNNPFINVLWVVIMVLIAAHTALRSTSLQSKLILIPISIAFSVAITLVGGYFLGVVMELDSVFNARYFIPITGSLLGNMLSANVIALNSYCDGLQRERQLYYYLLGNGATQHEAQMPFIRTALIKSFNPTIAGMAVMGLVSLPGTMIGQILGGSDPDVSIKYQIMILIINFAASMLAVILSIRLIGKRLFDEYGRLIDIK
jgi:putative ABC transport system permease protein